ncbi:MAG TPA: hypothetical protein VEY70_02075 [Metabacillus sp.]|nr:hypothetical protein [Metabacillus sp.]
MKKQTFSKRKVVLSGVALSTIGVTSYLLKDEKRKEKMNYGIQRIKNKAKILFSEKEAVMEKAGHPDPYDIGDNTMVAEGSMYSVNYFNKKSK